MIKWVKKKIQIWKLRRKLKKLKALDPYIYEQE